MGSTRTTIKQAPPHKQDMERMTEDWEPSKDSSIVLCSLLHLAGCFFL
jgi:hypothetical protein